MQTLSKEAEEKVISAVKRAVSLVDTDGLPPTDAIEKVAREESWGPDMVRFASHAYNTGRQTAQRESSDNALDKFAEFPIADPGEVVDRIWPAKVKTAAELHFDGVSPEYQKPPAWLAPREAEQKLVHVKAASARFMVKAAGECKECGKPMEQCTCSKKISLDKAMVEGNRLKRAAASARSEASVAYEQLVSRMGELADYFRKSARDRADFAYVEKAAGVYFGNSGLDLMDWVFHRNKMGRFKTARAADVKWGRDLVSVDFTAEPWNHVSTCLELAREVNQKRADEVRAKEAADLHDLQVMRPFAAAPTQTGISWSLIPDVGAEKQGLAPLKLLDISSDTKNLLGDVFDEPDSDPVGKAYEDLQDPAHAAKLQQIRTQAMLADMMNDETIGSHDPDTILQHYNEMSQLTPRAANQPSVVRSQLQRRLQGDVQPFEHNESLNIEKGLKDTYQPLPPEMNPGVPKPNPPKPK